VSDTPPLTLSVWIAGIVSRWKVVFGTAAVTLVAMAIAVVILPPVYEAHASFITPSTPGITGANADDPELQAALGLSNIALESPRYYQKLLESEEVRRRLLATKFPDPRTASQRDSATLADIMNVRNADRDRRLEIASKRLEESITTTFNLNTNVVSVDLRLHYSDVAAAANNELVAIADDYAQEQRGARAKQRRLFVAQRLAEAARKLADAEGGQRRFEDENRLWRNSPDLVATHARLLRESGLAESRYLNFQQELAKAEMDERSDRGRITIVDSAVPPRKAKWPRFGQLLLSGMFTAFMLGALIAGMLSFIHGNRNPGTRQQAAVEVRTKSWLSRNGFPIFAWGLVFHSLVITALFGWFGIPVEAVRMIAAWKEFLLAIFLAIVVLRGVTGRGPQATLAWPDLWVGGLVATALLFLVAGNLWLRFNLPAEAQFLGFRDAVYFMLLYFVGRSTPELASRDSAMRKLFILIAVTAVIGVIERMIVSPEMLVALGVASYFQDFLGVSAFTVGNIYGLPLNYWTMIGGHLFRRAGSVYLSGQGFAVPFLLFFPLATSWVFHRSDRSKRQMLAYVIISAALILTLTRMTILIALIQLVLFVSVRKRPEWAVAGLMVAGAVFLGAFAFIPGFPVFVWQTLSWQEGSSVSHINDWVNGIAIFFQHPWGSGLGTADQSAVRSGLKHLTGDNLYLKYGVEMGAVGLGLLVLTLAGIGRSAFRLFRNGVSATEQRMGLTLWLAAIGIAINGITAVVFSSITLGWLFFWLAGAAVTVSQSLPEARSGEAPR
jgi:hypothetical protein